MLYFLKLIHNVKIIRIQNIYSIPTIIYGEMFKYLKILQPQTINNNYQKEGVTSLCLDFQDFIEIILDLKIRRNYIITLSLHLK